MENKLANGDYVPGYGGIERLYEADALLARVLFRLQCRRGSFPFLPQLGSRLWTLNREKPAQRDMLARQYVAEALAEMPVTIVDVTVSEQPAGLLIHTQLQTTDDTITAEVSI